jgi:hypothetical protein
MCPACLASAAVVMAGVLSSGGLAALVAKVVTVKKPAALGKNLIQLRRNDDGYRGNEHAKDEGCAASGVAGSAERTVD